MDKAESEIDNIIESTTQNLENNNIREDETNNPEDTNPEDTNPEDNNTQEEDNSVSESSSIDTQNIEVFNIALHQYLKIDEEIKVLVEAIKLRNKTKKNLADTLGTYLRANEIRNVNLGGSYKGKKLETKVTYSSKGFSKENVTKVLFNELKEEADIFDKIMESISKTNVITEKWNLKIVNEKQNNSKSKIEKSKNKIDMAEELLNEED
jgi:hypothetical protein